MIQKPYCMILQEKLYSISSPLLLMFVIYFIHLDYCPQNMVERRVSEKERGKEKDGGEVGGFLSSFPCAPGLVPCVCPSWTLLFSRFLCSIWSCSPVHYYNTQRQILYLWPKACLQYRVQTGVLSDERVQHAKAWNTQRNAQHQSLEVVTAIMEAKV